MKITTPKTLYANVPIGFAVPSGNVPLIACIIKAGSGTVDIKNTNANTINKKIPAAIPNLRLPKRKSLGISSFFQRSPI